MACFSWRSVFPAAGDIHSCAKRPVAPAATRALPSSVQASKQQKQSLQASPDSISLSRRNTLLYMTAGVLTLGLIPAEPAQAGRRLENRRKVMEKLQKLKEKALASDPKPANDGNPPSESLPSTKEKRREPSISPLSEPQLP